MQERQDCSLLNICKEEFSISVSAIRVPSPENGWDSRASSHRDDVYLEEV
jgi:hypothetical protein